MTTNDNLGNRGRYRGFLLTVTQLADGTYAASAYSSYHAVGVTLRTEEAALRVVKRDVDKWLEENGSKLGIAL